MAGCGKAAGWAAIAKIPFVVGGSGGGVGELNDIAFAAVSAVGVANVDVDLRTASSGQQAQHEQPCPAKGPVQVANTHMVRQQNGVEQLLL